MRSRYPVTVYVCLILLLAASVLCLLGAVRVVRFGTLVDILGIWGGIDSETGEPSLAGAVRLAAVGAAVGLLALMAAFASLRGPVRSGQIEVSGSDGRVTVATAGLEEFIRRAASTIRGVQEAKARVRQKGNDLDAEVSVVLGGSRPVMEVTGEIQSRIRAEIEQRLGLPRVGKIRVHVSRMVPDTERPAEPSPPSSREE